MRAKSKGISDKILLAVLALCAFLELFILPSNIWISIGGSLIMASFLLYRLWFKKDKPKLLNRILSTALGFIYIGLRYITLSTRALSLIITLMFVVSAVFTVYFSFFDKGTNEDNDVTVLLFETFIFISNMIGYAQITNEIKTDFTNKFLYIPLLLALVAGIVTYFLCKDKILPFYNRHKKKNKPKEIVAVTIILVAISVLCGSIFMLDNLNFALDTSEPTSYVCTIKDKKQRRRRKPRHTYRKIKIEIDGVEKWIDVTAWEYSYYEVGKKVVVNLHDGFFGEPYLITKNMD